MFIIYGSSHQEHELGTRLATCGDCHQETPHRFTHTYRVGHVFWFPLFSYALKYARTCTRCNLYTEVPPSEVGPVPSVPWVHRMGLLVPMGALSLCCFCFPMSNLVMGMVLSASESESDSASVVEAPGRSSAFLDSFKTHIEDEAVEENVRAKLDAMGFESVVVSAASSNEVPDLRVLTLYWERMNRVSKEDRVRLLEVLEAAMKHHFPMDEAFVGLQGRSFWWGYSHRGDSGRWVRDMEEPTYNAEERAVDAIMARRVARFEKAEKASREEASSEAAPDSGAGTADDAVK